MSEKERKDIAEMVKTAEYLAKNDPQGLLIARSNMDILKARADMEKQEKQKEVVQDAGSGKDGSRVVSVERKATC